MPRFGDFHVPAGSSVQILPKILPSRELALEFIEPFLLLNEKFVWDGPYNTKDLVLVTRHGQSMGRLFVTDQRLLFWSDDIPKPHIGVFYDDIAKWKSQWLPMKTRGVTATVNGTTVLFAANARAIKMAEEIFRR